MKISAHIRLPEDLHAALVAEADRIGVSLNALVATLLADWRDKKETSK